MLHPKNPSSDTQPFKFIEFITGHCVNPNIDVITCTDSIHRMKNPHSPSNITIETHIIDADSVIFLSHDMNRFIILNRQNVSYNCLKKETGIDVIR